MVPVGVTTGGRVVVVCVGGWVVVVVDVGGFVVVVLVGGVVVVVVSSPQLPRIRVVASIRINGMSKSFLISTSLK
jgi:hypothetical protein